MTRDANEVFQYFFAIGLLLVPVFGGLERQCNQNTPIRGHLCGSNLNEVISLVCRDRGGFNNGYKKRSQIKQVVPNQSISQISSNRTADISPDFKTALLSPKIVGRNLFTRKMAHGFLAKRNAYQPGIICECCYFRCTITEMQEYCSYGSSDPDTSLMDYF